VKCNRCRLCRPCSRLPSGLWPDTKMSKESGGDHLRWGGQLQNSRRHAGDGNRCGALTVLCKVSVAVIVAAHFTVLRVKPLTKACAAAVGRRHVWSPGRIAAGIVCV